MSTKEERERIELLQGTLDLLILRTLLRGPAHGHAIAKTIEFNSDEVLQVEQGSLYPALHRLIKRRWISIVLAMAWPCAGPRSSVRRISRSSVPCNSSMRSRSSLVDILGENRPLPVGCQGEQSRDNLGDKKLTPV